MYVARVVCAVSGGVDSAVSALLLKRQGFNVRAVFMRNWDTTEELGYCSSDSDFKDAQYVCQKLSIKLHHVDFVKEYWNDVFTEVVAEYSAGHTPNPDILCNRFIKFNRFFKHAMNELNADFVATGHYARTCPDFYRSNRPGIRDETDSPTIKLLQALDTNKDQTFFLSQISQASLRHSIFPLGNLEKSQVKRIAFEAGLTRTVARKESMGMCFIGQRNFAEFIQRYISPSPGRFIDIETGRDLGGHDGCFIYTIGQSTHIPGSKYAFYVVDRDPVTRTVTVAATTDHPALYSHSLVVDRLHWVSDVPPQYVTERRMDCRFRFQHRHPLVPCVVKSRPDGTNTITLDRAIRAITPGQYAVLYLDDQCLGGAKIIKRGMSLYDMHCNELIHGLNTRG